MLPDDDNPLDLSLSIDQDDSDAKKPGAALASTAQLPVSQVCKSRRNRPSTRGIVERHNMFGALDDGKADKADTDNEI